MLYLRCLTSGAKIMVESRDILDYNKIIRKIPIILIRANYTITSSEHITCQMLVLSVFQLLVLGQLELCVLFFIHVYT